MLIAIFSDVHGNLTALEAVLVDIKAQAPDLVAFAGDLCLFGPRPAACLERVRQEAITAVYGNKDEIIFNPTPVSYQVQSVIQEKREKSGHIVAWTQTQLSAGQLAWLRTLPFHRRVSPTPHPKDDLFIVHANPKDVQRHIYPPEARQQEIYGEVKQPDSDNDLNHMLRDLSCDLLAFGHVHVPNIRHWHNKTLVNISSVSLPQDGDKRAKYGLLKWDKHSGWRIQHRYITYDVDEEIALLQERQPPGWESYQRQLETARPRRSI